MTVLPQLYPLWHGHVDMSLFEGNASSDAIYVDRIIGWHITEERLGDQNADYPALPIVVSQSEDGIVSTNVIDSSELGFVGDDPAQVRNMVFALAHRRRAEAR